MSQPQQLPAGWNPGRVRALVTHYDAQTDDTQADEIEAALRDNGVTLVAVPPDLVDEVRALVARRRSA